MKFTQYPMVLLMLVGWAIPGKADTPFQHMEIGNVTPSGFTVLWELPEPHSPEVHLFLDEEATLPYPGIVERETSPLTLGDPNHPRADYHARQQARTLQDEISQRGLSLVRVGGLTPGTTLFVRPVAHLDSGGTQEGPLLAITTPQSTPFVLDGRVAMVDFSAATVPTNGAIVRVGCDGCAHPLFAVVGDGLGPGKAFLNLTRLTDPSGENSPTEPDLHFSVLGLPGAPITQTVTWRTGLVVSETITIAYPLEIAPPVAAFLFDPIANQVQNIPFLITIRAVDDEGSVVTDYHGSAFLDANLPLSLGGGDTPNFIQGVLSGHAVAVAEAGTAQLHIADPDNEASGESGLFEVAPGDWTLAVNADPSWGGSVQGGGVYGHGGIAPISVNVEPGWRFEKWIGAGITDPYSPDTTVTMTDHRLITAVLVQVIRGTDYTDWARRHFLRDSDNPEIAGPLVDADDDGVSNILEFAFGRNPLFNEGDLYLPQSQSINGAFLFTYYRLQEPGQLIYQLQQAPAPDGPWEDHFPPLEDTTVTPLDHEMERVDILLPVEGTDPVFYRLKVLYEALIEQET